MAYLFCFHARVCFIFHTRIALTLWTRNPDIPGHPYSTISRIPVIPGCTLDPVDRLFTERYFNQSIFGKYFLRMTICLRPVVWLLTSILENLATLRQVYWCDSWPNVEMPTRKRKHTAEEAGELLFSVGNRGFEWRFWWKFEKCMSQS